MRFPWHSTAREPERPVPMQAMIPPGVPVAIVVSNEEGLGNLLALSLRGLGFFAFETTSPHRALFEGQFLRRLDLVVSDLALHGMSGATMLSLLRSNHPDAAAVMLSDEYRDEHARIPVMRKPFRCQEFVQTICAVTGERPAA
jgi:DNA-binding response OmpR family regulator